MYGSMPMALCACTALAFCLLVLTLDSPAFLLLCHPPPATPACRARSSTLRHPLPPPSAQVRLGCACGRVLYPVCDCGLFSAAFVTHACNVASCQAAHCHVLFVVVAATCPAPRFDGLPCLALPCCRQGLQGCREERPQVGRQAHAAPHLPPVRASRAAAAPPPRNCTMAAPQLGAAVARQGRPRRLLLSGAAPCTLTYMSSQRHAPTHPRYCCCCLLASSPGFPQTVGTVAL